MEELSKQRKDVSALLAEQSALLDRLQEVNRQLTQAMGGNGARCGKKPRPARTDFDRQAYAVGLIWKNPTISTRQLARMVGVSKSTLFLPPWKDVGDMLKARKRHLSAQHNSTSQPSEEPDL